MAKRNKPSDREWAAHVRERIQTSNVLARLLKGFEGEVDLNPNQVKIGLGLLNKVLPDLNHNMIEDTTPEASYESIVAMLTELLGEEATQMILSRMGAKKPEEEVTH